MSQGGGSSGGGGGGGGGGGKNDVVELTDSNFDELVLQSEDLWLVEFYAPWWVYKRILTLGWEYWYYRTWYTREYWLSIENTDIAGHDILENTDLIENTDIARRDILENTNFQLRILILGYNILEITDPLNHAGVGTVRT